MANDSTLRTPATTTATAKAQLTMVEHALCPLDSRQSLKRGFIHETTFAYTDPNRNRKKGKVQIGSVHGLSPTDELYLWGILGLALGRPRTKQRLLRHAVLDTSPTWSHYANEEGES